MKHWKDLVFSDIFNTKKDYDFLIFNIKDNVMDDIKIEIGDTVEYHDKTHEVLKIERFNKTFNGIDGNPLPGDNFSLLVKKV